MPRMSRLDTPGLLHHIIIRGIQRRKIFNDDKDRENFIERLSILLPKTKAMLRVVIYDESRPFSVSKRYIRNPHLNAKTSYGIRSVL